MKCPKCNKRIRGKYIYKGYCKKCGYKLKIGDILTPVTIRRLRDFKLAAN